METKDSFNSQFSAMDYWDEKPLILEGKLKLRVLQALYGAEFRLYNPGNTRLDNIARTYITPVINELEIMHNIKTRAIPLS